MGNISDFLPEFVASDYFFLTSGFILAFFITWFGIPAVNRLSRAKNLFDIPCDRSSHNQPVPRLGGTMIFAGAILSSVLFTDLKTASELKYIIAGMLILFFIGLKDDIVTLTPLKKAIGQLLAASIIVIPANIRIVSCYNIMGLNELSYLPSVFLTILIITGLINSFNFIDGVDGLASGIGIMASAIFGILFLKNDYLSYAVMCFSLMGSLLAFFYFNVISRKNKIFLGDTGSMIIGFLLAVFFIYLFEMPTPENPSDKVLPIAPALSLAIFFVPVFDGLRVSIIRLINGRSVFQADKNHIHHRLLNLTGSHLKTTLVILVFNVILILLLFLFKELGNKLLIIILILLGVAFSILLGITPKKQSRKSNMK